MTATLYTDGGARGNPGPAGIGYVLTVAGEKIQHGEYIGQTTNNQAEYQALRAGLFRAQERGVTELSCYLDSELVVKQVKDQYKVKHPDLKPLYTEIKQLSKRFKAISFTHVPRAKNAAADKLVNKAIDAYLRDT